MSSEASSRCYSVVSMFGMKKRCAVTAHGEPQASYDKQHTLWVERCEDEYAIPSYKPPFCVLYRKDWLQGDVVE